MKQLVIAGLGVVDCLLVLKGSSRSRTKGHDEMKKLWFEELLEADHILVDGSLG